MSVDMTAGLAYPRQYGDEWQAMFQVGVQYFHIGPTYETKEEAQWMVDQFCNALKNMGVEIGETE